MISKCFILNASFEVKEMLKNMLDEKIFLKTSCNLILSSLLAPVLLINLKITVPDVH